MELSGQQAGPIKDDDAGVVEDVGVVDDLDLEEVGEGAGGLVAGAEEVPVGGEIPRGLEAAELVGRVVRGVEGDEHERRSRLNAAATSRSLSMVSGQALVQLVNTMLTKIGAPRQ